MNSKKIILLIFLSSIIFSISYVGYYKFKIEKNSYIHSSTYVAGVNLSAANLFFNSQTEYNIYDFFDFQKINSSILRDYKSQKICKNIFSDKIFKLPITITSNSTASFTRVTYEITSDNRETGKNCLDDIHEYVLNEDKYAKTLIVNLKDIGFNYYKADGSLNTELKSSIISVLPKIVFFKKIDESSYETTPQKISITLNLFIISIFISILIVYFRVLFKYLKSLILELKK